MTDTLNQKEVDQLMELFDKIQLDLSGNSFPSRTNRLEAVENMKKVLEIHDYSVSEYTAEGSEHNQQDLDDVADWMNTTPDKLSVEVKQEPIEKFIKQIREMYGTYDEFPEDEDRTNRILKLLKRGAKPLPIYVEAGDPHLFVMEGRHRMVAFWLAEMKTIPVAYVSINSQQGVAEEVA